MACHTPSMRLTLFFNRMVFQSSGSLVESLAIADDSSDILSLLCKSTGQAATTGHLELGIDLGFSVQDDDDAGYLAFKELDANTKRFDRGPVLVGLKAGNSNVLLSGGVAGAVGSAFENYRHGLVTVTFLENVLGGELLVEDIQLDGVTEESFKDLIAIGFPESKVSSFRGRVRVPAVSGVTTLTIEWRGLIFLKTAGDVPALTMTYRRIALPNPAATPVNAPLTDTAHVLDTSTLGTFAANQYAELASDPLTVAPGDTLLFTIERDGETDVYTDEVHILRQHLKITGSA